jgi:glycosyltransferase involved in cell wall biosynthesis
MARKGYQVTIYGCGPEKYLDRLETHANLDVHLFERPSGKKFWSSRELVERLRRNGDGVDLLVIHAMFNPPNISVARAARRADIPYILCPHDPYHPELLKKNRFRKKLYVSLFERPMIQRAAGIQVLAPEHAQWVRPLGARSVVLVPNGFNPDGYLEHVPCRPDAGRWLQGDPALLSLGRLDVHQKGLDLLIRGFATALHTGGLTSGAALNFVGRDTRGIGELSKLAAGYGIAKHVNFLGEVTDEARAEILSECDALVLCSRFDGFALVVLEAMLAAKPVLVSREAGIATWVERAGAGVTTSPEPQSIRDALIELSRLRPNWKTIGENGRRYAHEHMTWSQVADGAVRAYTQVLALARRPPGPDTPVSTPLIA